MTFTVNDTVWQLRFVNPRDKNLRRRSGSFTIGMTDNNQKTVFIADNLSDYMTDKCLAHELTHVYAFTMNYLMSEETEEIVADFISLFGRDVIYLLDDLMGILRKAYIA